MISIGCCNTSVPLALRDHNGGSPANSHVLCLTTCRNLQKRLWHTQRTWIPTLTTLPGLSNFEINYNYIYQRIILARPAAQ
ncbi:hypothetical protein bcgnr5380_59400 [Bacillus cereus]